MLRDDDSQHKDHGVGTAVTVTRSELSAAALRAAASRCTDSARLRRGLALAMVLEGRRWPEAASLNGVDRQTLSNWVHRYNSEGIEGPGIPQEPGSGARPHPGAEGGVARCWLVEVHESTIGTWLSNLGLTRPQPRPVHPMEDAAAEATL